MMSIRQGLNSLNIETLHLESSKIPENKFSVSCDSGNSPCRCLVTREVAHLKGVVLNSVSNLNNWVKHPPLKLGSGEWYWAWWTCHWYQVRPFSGTFSSRCWLLQGPGMWTKSCNKFWWGEGRKDWATIHVVVPLSTLVLLILKRSTHLKKQSPFHPQAWHQDQCFPAQQDWYVNLDVTKTTYKCVWGWQISLIFDSTWLSTLKAMGTQLWPKIEFRWSDKRPPLHTICFVDVMIYRHRACQLPLPPFNCYPKSKDRSTCSQKGARSSPSEGQHWQQIGAEAAKNISILNCLVLPNFGF